MAKDMNTPFMPMGVFGILREALKIPSRNGKLFLSIALLFLIPSSLISLAQNFTTKPLMMDLSAKSFMLQDNHDPQQPGYAKLFDAVKNEAGILVAEQMFFLVVSSMVSLFAAMATIYVSAVAYYGKDLTRNELFVRIGKTWKRPLITWLCINLFNLGCFVLLLMLMGILTMIVSDPIKLLCLASGLGLLFICFYSYFAVLCKLGIVISVIEDGNYGIGALAKATELIKGRKRQGYILYVVFTLLGSAINWVLSLVMQNIHLAHATPLVTDLVLVNVASLENILIFVVFTLFYVGCKKNHGEKVEIEGESGYSLVPTVPLVEVSLP